MTDHPADHPATGSAHAAGKGHRNRSANRAFWDSSYWRHRQDDRTGTPPTGGSARCSICHVLYDTRLAPRPGTCPACADHPAERQLNIMNTKSNTRGASMPALVRRFCGRWMLFWGIVWRPATSDPGDSTLAAWWKYRITPKIAWEVCKTLYPPNAGAQALPPETPKDL